jgi:uncharacterized membrane protein
LAALAGFVVLRVVNGYGQASRWESGDSALHSLMSFVNITKYPPSLLFLLLTLGLGLLLLVAFERAGQRPWIRALCVFGAAPMFFYLLHLYVLKFLYRRSRCMAWWISAWDVHRVPAKARRCT